MRARVCNIDIDWHAASADALLRLPGVRKQMIVDPAPHCSDLAFLVGRPTRILDAVADRLLVNVQPDVMQNVR